MYKQSKKGTIYDNLNNLSNMYLSYDKIFEHTICETDFKSEFDEIQTETNHVIKIVGKINYYFTCFLFSDTSYISNKYQIIFSNNKEIIESHKSHPPLNVVDKLYHSILLNNQQIDISVPVYQSTVYFFILWEIFNTYINYFTKTSLNILYITSNKIKKSPDTIISNDIVWATSEFRRKTAQNNDLHNVIFLSENNNVTKSELDRLGIKYDINIISFDNSTFAKNTILEKKTDLIIYNINYYESSENELFRVLLDYVCFGILNIDTNGTIIIILSNITNCITKYSNLVAFLEKYFQNVHLYYPYCTAPDDNIVVCVCNHTTNSTYDDIRHIFTSDANNKTFNKGDPKQSPNLKNINSVFEDVSINYFFGLDKINQLALKLNKTDANYKRQFIANRKKISNTVCC